ncbi:MAG: ABC transporter permease, partial [Bifidobacteriaceae bacterium]|nr:ABC transporter permease [Bifidobacteriaceae bacterium]
REARAHALERLVGATRGQVFRRVLGGAAWIGLLSAAVGAAAGAALVAAALALPAVPLVFSWSAGSLIAPVAAGALVCVFGAAGPARQASKSSPLAAYRSSAGGRPEAKASRRSAPWVRLGLFAAALAGMAACAVVGQLYPTIVAAVVVAALGISLTRPGAAAAARALGAVGASRGWTAIAEACERILAKPGRSASVAGLACAAVAFVVMVGVGGASLTASVSQALTEIPQPDLAVVPSGQDQAEAAEIEHAVERVDGVLDSVLVATALVETHVEGQEAGKGTVAAASAGVAAVVRRGDGLGDIGPGVLRLSAQQPIPDGAEVTVTGDAGQIRLAAEVSGQGASTGFLNAEDFRAVAGDGAPQVWLRFAPGSDPVATGEAVKDALHGRPVGFYGTSERVAETAGTMRLITVLALGLFGAGVLIAVAGIANTIRSSVIERRQEMGLQRALGAFASAVRRGLVAETSLLVLVGSLVGAACGTVIALTGVFALAQSEDGVDFVPGSPAGFVAASLAAAVAVGGLVAFLAARQVVRVPPMAAIALS